MTFKPGWSSIEAAAASLVALLIATGCVTSEDPDLGSPDLGSTEQAVSRTATGYPVKVYFSKFDTSLTNPALVYAVNRASPTVGLATYSLQLLIAGPTAGERGVGYFSELNSILTGPSSCSAPHPTGGPDFKVTLNKKGTTAETGTATVQLCRATASPGVGADARVLAEVTATLKQFSTVTKVVLLTQTGHCFADGSNADACLH